MAEDAKIEAGATAAGGQVLSGALQRKGRVPAVIYGNKQDPLSIHVEEKALMRLLMTGHFMNSVVMIAAGGKTIRTLPKDVAFDPTGDRPLHVDFLRIGEHATVHVNVPVRFTDEADCPGIVKHGGVLNITHHEVELVCEAANIPGEIAISLKGLDVGASIHISDVKLPKGVEPAVADQDFAIATIAAQLSLSEEDFSKSTDSNDASSVRAERPKEEPILSAAEARHIEASIDRETTDTEKPNSAPGLPRLLTLAGISLVIVYLLAPGSPIPGLSNWSLLIIATFAIGGLAAAITQTVRR